MVLFRGGKTLRIVQGNELPSVIDLDDVSPEQIGSDNPLYIDPGKFLKPENILFQHQDRPVYGHEVVEPQRNAGSQKGIHDRTHVGPADGKFPPILDVHQVGDFPFGQQSMLGSGVEDEFEGKEVVEIDPNYDEIILVFKGYPDLLRIVVL